MPIDVIAHVICTRDGTSRLRSRAACWLVPVLALIAPLGIESIAHAQELRGRVIGSDNNPVANADFDVYDSLTGEKLPVSDDSDSEGRYRLDLSIGTYDLVVQPPASSGWAPAIRRSVVVSGDLSLELVVHPAARVLAVIRDASGAAIEAADLDFDRVDDGSRQPVLGDITSRFGTAAITVEQGTYVVTIDPPLGSPLAPVRIWDWDTRRGDTLRTILPVARTLTGRVRDVRGGSVGGGRLRFEDDSGRRVPSWGHDVLATGEFNAGVAPASLRVTVEPPLGSRLVALRTDPIDLTVDQTFEPMLEDGFVVIGRVTDRFGAPVAAADWDVTDEQTGERIVTPEDDTDPDGRYRLVIPTGSYRFSLVPPAGSGVDSLRLEGVRVNADTVIDVRVGGDTPTSIANDLRWAPRQNPTYRNARLLLTLPTASPDVDIDLYDVSGRLVHVLHRGAMMAGVHEIEWDGTSTEGARAHTGVYLARVRSRDESSVTRFVLLP